MFVRGHAVLFLCLYDLVNKGTPQDYYAKLRSCDGYIAVFFYLAYVSNTERHAISIQNGILGG